MNEKFIWAYKNWCFGKSSKNQVSYTSMVLTKEHRGSLQSISNDSWILPKASWINFMNIDFSWFLMILMKMCRCSGMPRCRTDTRLWPSERTLKMIIIHVENSWINEVPRQLWCVKGVPGASSGGPPSGQFGVPWWPGRECFAPFLVQRWPMFSH